MVKYVTKLEGSPKVVDGPEDLCTRIFKIPGIFNLMHLFKLDLTLEDHIKILSYFSLEELCMNSLAQISLSADLSVVQEMIKLKRNRNWSTYILCDRSKFGKLEDFKKSGLSEEQ